MRCANACCRAGSGRRSDTGSEGGAGGEGCALMIRGVSMLLLQNGRDVRA